MKTSTIVVFSVLFIIVLGFYLNLDTPITQFLSPSPSQGASEPLFPFAEGDVIAKIQLLKPQEGEMMTLEKEGDVWMIRHPLAVPADPSAARVLVSALTLSNRLRRLKREKGWEEYGLKKPDLKVGIETEDGKKRYLYFGADSPVGEGVYARWEGEEEYFLLDKNLKNVFSQSLYSLRWKKVFKIPVDRVTKIQMRVRAQTFELAQHTDKWFWMEPILILGETVEAEAIAQILEGLQQLYVKEFLDGVRAEDAKTGLSIPGDRIAIWEGKEREEGLELGAAVPDKDARYARYLEGQDAFLISQSHIAKVFETVSRAAEMLQK